MATVTLDGTDLAALGFHVESDTGFDDGVDTSYAVMSMAGLDGQRISSVRPTYAPRKGSLTLIVNAASLDAMQTAIDGLKGRLALTGVVVTSALRPSRQILVRKDGKIVVGAAGTGPKYLGSYWCRVVVPVIADDPFWTDTSDTVLTSVSVTNLCLQSEALGTSPWVVLAGGTVTANAAIAPDGTTTADLVAGTTAYNDGCRQELTLGASGTKTVSFFIKQNVGSHGVIDFLDATTGAKYIDLTWSGGVPVLTPPAGITVAPAISVGNGWYRLAFTVASVDTSHIICLDIHPQWNGSNGDSFYFWGIQAENAATPGPYLKTTTGIVTADVTSLPIGTGPVRLDVDIAGVTNLCLRSESLEASPWTPNDAAVLANTTIAPDGTLSADTIRQSDAPGEYITQVVTFTGNGTKVISCYIKQGTAVQSGLALYDSTAVALRNSALITWVGGVPVLTAYVGAGTLFAPVAVGGGWYRIAIACDSVVAANTNAIFLYPTLVVSTASGSLILWGVQAENAAVPGVYVHTTTIPVSLTNPVVTLYDSNAVARLSVSPTIVIANGDLLRISRTNQAVTKRVAGVWSDASSVMPMAFDYFEVREGWWRYATSSWATIRGVVTATLRKRWE